MFHPFDPRDSVSSGGREQSEGICVIHPKTKNVVRRAKVDHQQGGARSIDPKIDLKQSNLEKRQSWVYQIVFPPSVGFL
jgi:hypothetical protein